MKTADLSTLLRLLDAAPGRGLIDEQHAEDVREALIDVVARARLYNQIKRSGPLVLADLLERARAGLDLDAGGAVVTGDDGRKLAVVV